MKKLLIAASMALAFASPAFADPAGIHEDMLEKNREELQAEYEAEDKKEEELVKNVEWSQCENLKFIAKGNSSVTRFLNKYCPS
jgi:hypothetical protein